MILVKEKDLMVDEKWTRKLQKVMLVVTKAWILMMRNIREAKGNRF